MKSCFSFRQSLTRAVVPAVVAVALVFSVLGLSSNREAIGDLFGRLGFSQTVERICPRIAEQFSLNLHCMSDDERRQFFAEGQPINPDDTTEGLRLMTLRNAVANIAQHPWLGVGVGRGSDRFIAAPVVPNLWLEVAHEGGLMALLAFGFGMAYTLSRWGAFERHQRDVMIVLALWFLIAWQFIETFPRLDLWVAVWVVLVWTKRESEVKQDAPRDHVFTEGPEGFTPRGIATL